MLYRLGFKSKEIAWRRCEECGCKVMIHTASAAEFTDIEVTLICGDCARIKCESDPSLIKATTPLSQSIFERAMNSLRRN